MSTWILLITAASAKRLLQQTIGGVSCGGFENCASYFDGCNSCSCSGAFTQCQLKFCEPANYTDAYCESCNDGFTANALGVCEEDASTAEPAQCGGFENCASYFDGCNTCSCGGLFQQCTTVECDANNMAEPYCVVCEDGYALSANAAGNEVCEQVISTTEEVYCGGFDNCVAYFDGCNSCGCGGAFSYCTEMFCDVYADAYCSDCADGFALAETGLCVEDVPETTTNANVSMC